MSDREKVIKGLEVLHVHFKSSVLLHPKDFVSEHDASMIADAIALLQAQEPRVLTLEEVVGNVVLGREKKLWFEFENDGIEELNANDITYNDYLCDEDMPILYEPNLKWVNCGLYDGVIVAEYNQTWRCWTSRPSNELREAAAWES